MSQPLDAFRNSFKIPELKQRIIFTLMMIAVYRIGANVPTPGIDGAALADLIGGQGGILGMYNLFSGGALEQASIFALGIMPYITASIIMQLLVAVVPALEKLQKEGQQGQKKINEYTRYFTIVLGVVQSIGIALTLQGMSAGGGNFITVDGYMFYILCILSFTTGTAFIMWLGEQISEYGVGNGMSLIIFVSIIAGLPSALSGIAELYSYNQLDILRILFLVFAMVVVVAGAIYVTTAQRRIPIQYPRQVKGRRVYQGARNYLPLKVNQAGVIPIIFASSILMLPSMLAGNFSEGFMYDLFNIYLSPNGMAYNLLYGILIVFFSFFYTAITFNPVEVADNLKKNGGVIMGVRPGKQTAEFLNHVMTRITLVGALFLAGVAMLPQLVYSVIEISDWRIASFFGGTSLLILVGVALDTVRQIETHLVMRNYDGFMKGRRIRGRRS